MPPQWKMPRGQAAVTEHLLAGDDTSVRRASLSDVSAMRRSWAAMPAIRSAALAEGQGLDVDGVGPEGVAPEEVTTGAEVAWISKDSLAGRRKRLSVNLDVRSFENGRALARKGSVCGGVLEDIRRRSKHYASDWSDPFCSIATLRLNVSATSFMFVAMFFTVVALAEVKLCSATCINHPTRVLAALVRVTTAICNHVYAVAGRAGRH